MISGKISLFLLLLTVLPMVGHAQTIPTFFDLERAKWDINPADEPMTVIRPCKLQDASSTGAFLEKLKEKNVSDVMCPPSNSGEEFCLCISKKADKVTVQHLKFLYKEFAVGKRIFREKDGEKLTLLLKDEIVKARDASVAAELFGLSDEQKRNVCTQQTMARKLSQMSEKGCDTKALSNLFDKARRSILNGSTESKEVNEAYKKGLFSSYDELEKMLDDTSYIKESKYVMDNLIISMQSNGGLETDEREMLDMNLKGSNIFAYFNFSDSEGNNILGDANKNRAIDLTNVEQSDAFRDIYKNITKVDPTFVDILKPTLARIYSDKSLNQNIISDLLPDSSRCDAVASVIGAYCKKKAPEASDYLNKAILDNPATIIQFIGEEKAFYTAGALQCQLSGISDDLFTPEAKDFIDTTSYYTPIDKSKVGLFMSDDDQVESIISYLTPKPENSNNQGKNNNANHVVTSEAQKLKDKVLKGILSAGSAKMTRENSDVQQKMSQIQQKFSTGKAGGFKYSEMKSSYTNTAKREIPVSNTQKEVSQSPVSVNNPTVPQQVMQQAVLPSSFTPTMQTDSTVRASKPKKVTKTTPEPDNTDKVKEDSVEKRLLDMLEEKNKTQSAQANSSSKKEIEELRRELKELKNDSKKSEKIPLVASEPKQLVTAPAESITNAFTGTSGTGSSSENYAAKTNTAGVTSSSVAGGAVSSDSKQGGQSRGSVDSGDSDSKRSMTSFSSAKAGSGAFQSGGATSSGGDFALTKDEVDVSSDFIVDERLFKSNDSNYIESIYKKTGGKPIYLEQVNEFGDEVYVMMEAVKDKEGKIKYVAVSKEQIKNGKFGQADEKKKSAPSLMEILNGAPKEPAKNGDRIKAEDLNNLINIGEKL